MDTAERIARISEMEETFDQATAALTEFEQALTAFEEAQPTISTLASYYGSPEWFDDRDAEEDGREENQPGRAADDVHQPLEGVGADDGDAPGQQAETPPRAPSGAGGEFFHELVEVGVRAAIQKTFHVSFLQLDFESPTAGP